MIKGDLNHRFPVAMAGIYMAAPVSPFLAETIALDEATSFYHEFITESLLAPYRTPTGSIGIRSAPLLKKWRALGSADPPPRVSAQAIARTLGGKP